MRMDCASSPNALRLVNFCRGTWLYLPDQCQYGVRLTLTHRPEISVAQLAREHGINDNLLFKWRQYWREGKLRPPSTTENNVPELLPITLDAEDVVPATSPRSQPVAAAAPESLNISCEVTFRHGSLRLNGAISENILNLLIRELKR
ncbi:transposase [Klebsiella pneumoniae]|uniref:transposase n=1 Tax=Klebsiella pneumoniae TaxID=573 RepID=UPI003F1A22C7